MACVSRVGRWKMLEDHEVEKLHATALEVLERVGVRVLTPKLENLLLDNGGVPGKEKGIVRLPASAVEKLLSLAPKQVVYGGREPEFDVCLGDGKTLSCRPISGAEGYLDLETGEYRKATIADVKEWSILCDALENIDTCAGLYPSDVPVKIRDLLMLRTMIENTRKHVHLQPDKAVSMRYYGEMCAAVQGGEAELKRRPLPSILNSATCPLMFRTETVETIWVAGKYGIPVEVNSMPILGATGPVSVAGSLVLSHAELLATAAIIQIGNPGAPVVYSPRPMVMDMASGNASSGAVELALMAAAGTQVVKTKVGIPVNMEGPATDSPLVDGQSQIERVYNTILPALAGADMLTGPGHLQHYYTVSPVQLVIDNDILGMTARIVRGIEIDTDLLGLEVIDAVGPAPGVDYLTTDHTLRLFKSQVYRPALMNRKARGTWESEGGGDLNHRARERAKEFLRNHSVPPLEDSVTRELDRIMKSAEKEILGQD